MARITVEDCLTKETNRFALVQLAAKRTKQLLHGARVLTNQKRENKAVVTALREIADGVVRFMTETELKEQQEQEALRQEAEQQPDAQQLVSGEAVGSQAFPAGPTAITSVESNGESEEGTPVRDGDGLF